MNKVILLGRFTKDPDLRYTSAGAAVCGLSLAVNYRYTSSKGERIDEACFIDGSAWEKHAENISKNFKKGQPILIEGRLKYDSWEESKTKQKRSAIRFIVDRWHFVEPKKDSEVPEAPASDDSTPPF